MQHQIRRCGAVAFAALRRVRHFLDPPSPLLHLLRRRGYALTLLPLLHRRHEPAAACKPGADHGAEDEIDRAEERIPPGANQSAGCLTEEYSRANKEFHKLESTVELIKELRSKQKEITGLTSLVTNSVEEKDMREMAAEELLEAVEEEKRLQHELFRTLLPKDEADERDCILR
ncbi:hypothetical protein ZWY2020_059195 [Hordeum vulgare]|nr:hypothetical protein ZWY2020_059195 [Hordeum vulgare]